MEEQPRYQWVAEQLRRPILTGEFPPGMRLPSRSRLALRHGVSEQVSRHALRLLVSEGLVEARPGAGYFVREAPQAHRFVRTDRSSGGLAPLRQGSTDVTEEPAGEAVARRLRLRDGDPVYRSRCIGSSEGQPVALHTAWEPTSLTNGTLRSPCDSDPRLGLLERLHAAGTLIDRVVEEVAVRPLQEPEAAYLQTAPGLPALVVERTHLSSGRPVQTSDLVSAVDHCRLVYRLSLAQPRFR
ncbi:GntR family transcriptional regulator [Nocardiopsis coralliicola]